MAKPTYRPRCQLMSCLNGAKAEVSNATTYIHIDGKLWHVCGPCGHKLAIEAGLEEDPKGFLDRTVRPRLTRPLS